MLTHRHRALFFRGKRAAHRQRKKLSMDAAAAPAPSRPELERYIGLLAAALESEGHVILPDEAQRLELFRKRHGISADDHQHALTTLSSTDADLLLRLKQGEEVATYLHMVAQTIKENRADTVDVNSRLAAYREKHGISPALHAAAMDTLATDPSRVLTPRDSIGVGAGSVTEASAPAAAPLPLVGRCGVGVGGGSVGGGGGLAVRGGAGEALLQEGEGSAAAVARLDAQLMRKESQNAARRVELDQLEAALQEMDRRVVACAEASPLRAAEVAELQKHLDAHEEASVQLQAAVAARRERLKVVQELLDGREAELYETEEAVRDFERKGRTRAAELGAASAELSRVEGRMRARQRELMRLEDLASGGGAAARWDSPQRSRQPPRSSAADTDADVEARALRDAAKLRGGGGPFAGDAGYVHFHTLCMGIKLAVAGHDRLQNVRIDELWEEVRWRELPRSEWRDFAHRRLLGANHSRGGGYAPMRDYGAAVSALAAPGSAAVGAMALAGDTVATFADGLSAAFTKAFWSGTGSGALAKQPQEVD